MAQQQQQQPQAQFYQSYGANRTVYSGVPSGVVTSGAPIYSTGAPIYRAAVPTVSTTSAAAPAAPVAVAAPVFTTASAAPLGSTAFPAYVNSFSGAPAPLGSFYPAAGYGQQGYLGNNVAPFDIRAYYGPGRRTEKYGEILYSAEIWDDREEDNYVAPTPAPAPAPAPVVVAAPIAAPAPAPVAAPVEVPIINVAREQPSNWRMEIEVIRGMNLPASSGGLLSKDTIDPYVIVKLNNTQAFTPAMNNGGATPVWNYKMLFGGPGQSCPAFEGLLEVYDRDGEMSQKPPKSSDELIGKGSFSVRDGLQEVQVFDAKNKITGTIEIRIGQPSNN
jgi:hypothetical protein